jgi:hypothetical protein
MCLYPSQFVLILRAAPFNLAHFVVHIPFTDFGNPSFVPIFQKSDVAVYLFKEKV